MSNFQCEKCGTICYDTPNGYITGCEHYQANLQDEYIMTEQAIAAKFTRFVEENRVGGSGGQ